MKLRILQSAAFALATSAFAPDSRAACTDLAALEIAMSRPALAMFAATQNAAQMLRTSTNNDLQLSTGQISLYALSGITVEYTFFTQLMSLHKKMKLASDRTAVAEDVSSSAQQWLRRTRIHIETVNRFIPTLTNQSFSQELVNARNGATELMQTLTAHCE